MQNEKCGTDRDPKKFCDGHSDNLEPLESIDLGKCADFDQMLSAMSKTAFGGRNLGEAAEVLCAMAKDKDCLGVGTFAGAMSVAKMGGLLCDMVDSGMLGVVVSTGALMAHGFVEAAGMKHFKYRFGKMDDGELYKKGYDRVYDTLELEKNLDDAEVLVAEVLEGFKSRQQLCSWKICHALGKRLSENFSGKGILKSTYEANIPVFIPAFTDSEFGLDFGIYRRRQRMKGKLPLVFNPYLDLELYTKYCRHAKKLGLFTIGGGVPRNWAQQVGPYLDIIQSRIGEGGALKRFDYALRICPEPVHWGGLSGCTYSEGVSWGKFTPENEGGRFAEVLADATIAWPILLKGVFQRLQKEGVKIPLEKNIQKFKKASMVDDNWEPSLKKKEERKDGGNAKEGIKAGEGSGLKENVEVKVDEENGRLKGAEAKVKEGVGEGNE
ncbi:deoxyhypusine synthase [Candidatus Micrarchaeota archaeon CG11_big_fil_rev_8_21_14_0_20_47_5]|nr:MAG: deoxyhypusine synthase [Candidatus Micrarchaeota archaeon CG11_big_fil_rev_8_21_14_0_20_47_5]